MIATTTSKVSIPNAGEKLDYQQPGREEYERQVAERQKRQCKLDSNRQNQTMKKIYLPNPIIELGKITFNQPIYVTITHIDETAKRIFFEWDFGMEDEFIYDSCWLDLNQIAKLEDKIIAVCKFELGHAFFHCPDDPNYTPYHWALRGWYKDKVTLEEYGL